MTLAKQPNPRLKADVENVRLSGSLVRYGVAASRWASKRVACCVLLGTALLGCTTVPPQPPTKEVSDEEILRYASAPYDKRSVSDHYVLLGVNRSTPVVAEYICSDVCPDYTVRVVHYQLSPRQACADIPGVERKQTIPVAIAAMDKLYCYPQIINDHWDAYIR